MALEQKLRLKLAQRLVMTPSLQQAIKLLQLSRLELEETLSQEILENPILEVDEAAEERASARMRPSAARTGGEESRDESSAAADEPAQPGRGGRTRRRAAGGRGAAATPEETYGDIDIEAFFSDYLGDRAPTVRRWSRSRPRTRCRSKTCLSCPDLADHLSGSCTWSTVRRSWSTPASS